MHPHASSNEADGEEHDDGSDVAPSFDELPSASTLRGAKPLTRTHVAVGPLDLSLSVDEIITNVLHVAPLARSRKKASSRYGPSLPTLGMFRKMALEDASPHVHCSSCGHTLGSETSGDTYRLVGVVPQASLCASCFMEPTAELARLLFNNTTVQRISMPAHVGQLATPSDGPALPADPVDVESPFQIVEPSPVYIAELCPTCGDRCRPELLRSKSDSALYTPLKVLRITPGLSWSQVHPPGRSMEDCRV